MSVQGLPLKTSLRTVKKPFARKVTERADLRLQRTFRPIVEHA